MSPEQLAPLLKRALEAPLPGHAEFLALSGYPRPRAAEVGQRNPPPRESAVLVLFFPRNGSTHTLFMRRPTYPGVHSGQVAFPGGKREPQDRDLRETATREFLEETGALGTEIHIVGALTQLYIPPSDILVTPFVAHTNALAPLAPDPMEVADLIEAPLELLLRDDILKRGPQPLHTGGMTREVPYFDVLGNQVWGATALMLAELRHVLRRHL